MSARVLVVDDLAVNVRLLEAKLSAEYYTVLTANSGREALECVKNDSPDIVLLDVMMPEMDGFEVCRAIKADPNTAHLPVIMVTALSEPADRVRGLEAGADDFVTKPVNDIALFARLRSLLRLKMLFDELRLREETSRQIGALDDMSVDDDLLQCNRVLIVDDSATDGDRIAAMLPQSEIDIVSGPEEALEKTGAADYDLIVVSLSLSAADPLRLCSQLRSQDSTRRSAILISVDEDDTERLARALDLGVNDYIMKPIDESELRARVRTQVRYKAYHDRLRGAYEESVTMALTDSLTGLYNRRYVEQHLAKLAQRGGTEGGDVAVLMVDIDHFKAVNDTHGHDIGDEVLREMGQRLKNLVRSHDLAARLGGEEFVVVMSTATDREAQAVAERLRRSISGQPIPIAALPDGALNITVSVGVALRMGADETPDQLLKRADDALYEAKRGGRDCVVMAA